MKILETYPSSEDFYPIFFIDCKTFIAISWNGTATLCFYELYFLLLDVFNWECIKIQLYSVCQNQNGFVLA